MHTKLTTKLVAIAAALVAVSAGASVGAGATVGAGPSAPSSTTTTTTDTTVTPPPVATPVAVPTTTVGSCHGLTGLASVKSDYIDPNDGLPAGLVANIPTPGANHDVRISIKGVAGPDGSFGTCTFSGDNTPGAGTYNVARWTALLVSPATDCVPDNDPSEYPLSGKTTIEFTDGSRTQAYSQTAFGVDPRHDILTQTGVVTKGNGLGALFVNQVFYAPIRKVAGTLPAASSGAPYPGYEYDATTADACAGSPPGATADARDLIIGDGVSGLTGETASGYTFHVGS